MSHKSGYRFDVIPVKIQEVSFVEIDRVILKHMWKHRGPRTDKTIRKKKEQA